EAPRPVHDVVTPPLPAESPALAPACHKPPHAAFDVEPHVAERPTRIAHPEVVHPASGDYVHPRDGHLRRQVPAGPERVTHRTQQPGDLLPSRSQMRISSAGLRARYPPKLEAQEREDGAGLGHLDHPRLLRVERHADRFRLSADSFERSIGPLPAPV